MTSHQSAAVPVGLAQVLAGTPALAFAVLIGSRANHTAHEGSDWDIADMALVLGIVREQRYRIVTAFLMQPLPSPAGNFPKP